ncbi:ribonuclease H family protein [Klebsiella pneumoniae]|uniref:ribonuclease H family protein n=1 Tax=Klebsiella pneumoniae TaxID=573 RepID=UPI00405573C7
MFTITTDASEYALGAVLSQASQSGDRPIAYASRRLTEAETRYSALERELLGIIWAIEHFRLN